jgi:hypothetical protein
VSISGARGFLRKYKNTGFALLSRSLNNCKSSELKGKYGKYEKSIEVNLNCAKCCAKILLSSRQDRFSR